MGLAIKKGKKKKNYWARCQLLESISENFIGLERTKKNVIIWETLLPLGLGSLVFFFGDDVQQEIKNVRVRNAIRNVEGADKGGGGVKKKRKKTRGWGKFKLVKWEIMTGNEEELLKTNLYPNVFVRLHDFFHAGQWQLMVLEQVRVCWK